MRKNLLLTALLSLVAVFGMAQTATWPITLTRANGLPGQYAGMHYEFTSEMYKFDEAFNTLRFTVCSTNTTEGYMQTSLTDGISSGWGPGFPFFTLSELTILDANGEKIEYIATSNAAAANEGPIENLNNGNLTDHFHSTYYTGGCPQEYHYVELEFNEPISEFQIVFQSRSNLKNAPTYVGLTPGTEYLPYPEQEMQVGEQVTTLEGLAEEGAFFLIKGNAPEFEYELGGTKRTYPGGGFWNSPYAGHVTANAASLIYLIPEKNVENSYKICWLNNGHYLSNQEGAAWLNWTAESSEAGYYTFSMCDSVTTDFIITRTDSMIVGHDALGKMTYYYSDDRKEGRSRPTAWNFTIYKAEIAAGNLASQLTDLIADAKARMEKLGKMEEYDTEGAWDALITAIDVAEKATTASDILIAKLDLEEAIPNYAVVGLNAYLDSMDIIMEKLDEGELITSEAPEWVKGSFPADASDNLQAAQDAVLLLFDNYTTIADVDAGLDAAVLAIDNFWSSQINNVIEFPYRVGLPELRLPGEKQANGSFRWESPVYYLTEEVSTLRFTVFDTNNHAKYSNSEFVFPTYGEFVIMNALGDTIKLTELDWSSNSVHATDGIGLAGLCDGDIETHYHAAWDAGQVESYDADPDYVYIEAQLPEPISAFKFVQYGRKNSVNTPIDFAITTGSAITPNEAPLPYAYDIQLGEQITDASQIVDGEIYVIRGLYNCNPNAYLDGIEPGTPRYFAGDDVFGTNLQAPAAFLIKSTGDGDGTFYIQSLKDGKYWTKTTDENGWGYAGSTLDLAVASKVKIEPANHEGLDGSMVIYEYCESMIRDDESMPYVIFQDWGDLATFSVTGLDMNDLDGEGEWYINKAVMPEGNLYMLSGLMIEAEKYAKLKVGSDPGFYSQEVVGKFQAMYEKALKAQAKNDESVAKEIVMPLFNAIQETATAKPNPVTPGTYVFVSSHEQSSWTSKKAMYAYDNSTPEDQYIGNLKYKMYWSNAPEDMSNPHKRFQFELIPATEDMNLGLWREAGYITAEDSLNAYYIKHVETGYYIKGAEGLYRGIGLTESPESPFVIRLQDDNDFDIYCPLNDGEWTAYRSLYFRNSGYQNSDVSTWSPGGNETAKFHFRRVGDPTGIDTPIIGGGEQGDVLVSTSYYTVGGTAVSAPVKGINIVKKVYANGVVETEKVFVK